MTQSAEALCNIHVFLLKDIHCSTVQTFLLFPVYAPYKVVIFEPFHVLFEFELRIYTILFGYNICPIMLVMTIWWYFKTIATLKYEDGKVQPGTAVDAAHCRGSPYSFPPPGANKEAITHVLDATAHWARRRPRRDENGREMGREVLCSCPVE